MTVTPEDIAQRLDLRDEPIFTIDSADAKDIDDAISVHKAENGYKLGVHIADVSHYVKAKSAIDNEAYRRGTSVYFANARHPHAARGPVQRRVLLERRHGEAHLLRFDGVRHPGQHDPLRVPQGRHQLQGPGRLL